MTRTNVRAEIVARTPGSQIDGSKYRLGRCEGERWVRREGAGGGFDGNWAKIQGCNLAFAFRLQGRAVNASVTCPSCGMSLDQTTRRLRAGFLVLTDEDVVAIQASAGRAVDVSVLAPISAPAAQEIAEAPVAPSPAAQPAPAPKASPRLEAAVKALEAFDAKPRCSVCWSYNASAKTSDRCGFCRQWNSQADSQMSQGERDQYTYRRQELTERVAKAGGMPAPSPVAGYDAHVAERTARKLAERARRQAEVDAMRARGRRP